MSKLFFDHLLDMSDIDKKVKKIVKNKDERDEILQMIDEIVNHRVMGCIFSQLPEECHEEFVAEFAKRPHDESLLSYVSERVTGDIEEFIQREIHVLADELLLIIHGKVAPHPSH